MTEQRPLPFRVQSRVRWSECDPLGIIWYGSYLKYFEVAEHEMFRAAGLPYEVLRVEREVQLPRRACTMEFVSPAQMDELLDIEVGIAKLGSSSLTMRFEAYRASDRTLRATAMLTVVCVEKTSITKRVIPVWVRDALSPYVVG